EIHESDARHERVACNPRLSLARGGGRLHLRMQKQLLHAPIGAFSDVHFGRRWTGQRVSAGKLLELAPRATNDPKHTAVQRKLEDPSWERTFPEEEHLVGTGRDAKRIRGANHRHQAL